MADFEELWISPTYRMSAFPGYPDRLEIEQKISIFEDRILGWYLNVAEQLGELSHKYFRGGTGFAELAIVMSYFEMIARFQQGSIDDKTVSCFFKAGFRDVFPTFRDDLSKRIGSNKKADELIELAGGKLYKEARCGLYHAATTGRGIILTGDMKSPISLELDDKWELLAVCINPLAFTQILKRHFDSYICQLKDAQSTTLRDNFERRFNFLHGVCSSTPRPLSPSSVP